MIPIQIVPQSAGNDPNFIEVARNTYRNMTAFIVGIPCTNTYTIVKGLNLEHPVLKGNALLTRLNGLKCKFTLHSCFNVREICDIKVKNEAPTDPKTFFQT